MRGLLEEHLCGRADHNFRLWILLNLEIWHRLNWEGLSVAAMGDEIERLLGRPASTRRPRLDAAD